MKNTERMYSGVPSRPGRVLSLLPRAALACAALAAALFLLPGCSDADDGGSHTSGDHSSSQQASGDFITLIPGGEADPEQSQRDRLAMIEAYADRIAALSDSERSWSLCDIDGSGVPELLFCDTYTLTTNEEMPNAAYTYDREIKELGQLHGSSFWHTPGSCQLISYDGHGTGVGDYYTYVYNGESLYTVTDEQQYILPDSFPFEDFDSEREVTEADFEAFVAEKCSPERRLERFECGSREDAVGTLRRLLGMDGGAAPSDVTTTQPPTATTEATAAPTTTTAPPQPTATRVSIDSKLQYNLNIYLSNFSEAYMASFDGMPDRLALIDFAMMHNHLNKYEQTYESCDIVIDGVNYYERIRTKFVAETIKKYFGTELSADDYRAAGEKDGYLYFDWTGGWLSEGFTIVDGLTLVDKNTYEAHFFIYQDWQWYGYDGLYSMTPADIEAAKEKFEAGLSDRQVTKSGEGTARIRTGDLYDRSGYKILSYSVERF